MSGFRATLSLAAIACCAYAVADVAHEALGHGGACVALGGKLIVLSTTYEDCSIRSPFIDGAGPLVGLAIAFLALVILRLAPPRSQAARIFLCLLFAFAAFWNVGYMIKSGLLDQGDWAFVIADLQRSWSWHLGLAGLGVALYVGTMRVLGRIVANDLSGGVGSTPLGFALTAVVAAAALSALAAAFDPRGPSTILTDALPSSLASVGLVWTGWVLSRRLPDLQIATQSSPLWLAAGAAAAVVFIGVLGPGLGSY